MTEGRNLFTHVYRNQHVLEAFINKMMINFLDPHSILTTFGGSLCPGKYFTFSWVSLMISVSFLPSIFSSYTYIVTRSLKLSKRCAFAPTIFAIAEPLQWHNKTNLHNSSLRCIVNSVFDHRFTTTISSICFAVSVLSDTHLAIVVVNYSQHSLFSEDWSAENLCHFM